MSNATFTPGPLLSKIADELEVTIRELIAADGDEWDSDDLRRLVGSEVRFGDVDLDLDLVTRLIADTPQIILLRYQEGDEEEKVTLHAVAEEAIQHWLIVTLRRRLRS